MLKNEPLFRVPSQDTIFSLVFRLARSILRIVFKVSTSSITMGLELVLLFLLAFSAAAGGTSRVKIHVSSTRVLESTYASYVYQLSRHTTYNASSTVSFFLLYAPFYRFLIHFSGQMVTTIAWPHLVFRRMADPWQRMYTTHSRRCVTRT